MTPVNIITFCNIINKNSFIIRILFRICRHKYGTSRNPFWMITQIVSLFRAKHRELVPKFRSKGRDSWEKERGEERMRKRVGNDGHVREFDVRTLAPVGVLILFAYALRRSDHRRGPRKLGRYPRNNGLSIAVSCQQVRVAKSQFMKHMCALSFVVPVIDSAITEYIFFFLLCHKVIFVSAVANIFAKYERIGELLHT